MVRTDLPAVSPRHTRTHELSANTPPAAATSSPAHPDKRSTPTAASLARRHLPPARAPAARRRKRRARHPPRREAEPTRRRACFRPPKVSTRPRAIHPPQAGAGQRVDVWASHQFQVDAVRDVVQRLLPRLSSREVPRLEAVRPTPDPSVWTVTYGGIEAQVRITVSAELPAGRATLEPGSITLSGHAPDRMGDAITQAAVRQVLAEYGEHVRAGAVGSLAAQAVRAAGLSAADRLATEHPDLVSDGYRLRTATVKHGELLIAEGRTSGGGLQFARDRWETWSPRPHRRIGHPEGLPIYQITISEQIPEADRAATVPRVVAREVAEQLYQLRHSRGSIAGSTSGRRPTVAAQQGGDLAELRLELGTGRRPLINDSRPAGRRAPGSVGGGEATRPGHQSAEPP